MVENNHYTSNSQEEDELEIDLMVYVRKLWNARKQLLKVAGIAAIAGIVIAFSIPKEYTVNVALSPEAGKTGRTSSSLASMASMLGLGGGMGSEANALNLTMTSEIISSTPFILELFDTRVQTLDGATDTTLVAYLATESRPWWNTVMSLPSMAIGGIRSLFSTPQVVEEKPINPFQLTRKEMGQVGAIRRVISAEVEKTGMTQIQVTLQDPLVAAAVADTVVSKIQKYITQYKTSKAKEDCKYWEQLYQERQKDYHQAQEAYAKYVDTNQGVVLQSVKIEQERLQNEMNVALQVFTQVATQLQMSRAKVQEEKPVFAVLEPAMVPILPSNTNKKIIILGIVFLALVIASGWIMFGKTMWESLKQSMKE
jgi:uncharacterized protein involved in exopolysaccharide biosynthesis